MRYAYHKRSLYLIEPIIEVRPSSLRVIEGPQEFRLPHLQLDFLSVLQFHLSARLVDRLLKGQPCLPCCAGSSILKMPNSSLFSCDFQPGRGECVLRICKLPGQAENPLLLQLEPRDEKLRPNARARHLTDLGAKRANFGKQGILS